MSEKISSSRHALMRMGESSPRVARCERRSVASPPRPCAGLSPAGSAETEAPSVLHAPLVQAPNALNGEFLTILSHELRNSLCVIRMAAGILHTDVAASTAVIKARMLIEHQTAQMSRLVEDLLDTSRARNGQMSLKCKGVDLCAVAMQAAQAVEFTMQRRNHYLTMSLPAGPLWLQADPARLEQVLVNLLFNAAKYTDSGGRIQMSVEQEAGEAVLRVRDNGIGIAPDVLPRVFDLFAQADPSSGRSNAGLGIGLALVRNLVDRHGGCVMASSAGLGQGSEFVVRLPLPA